MSVFDNIYTTNSWGFGSGHGSLPSVTRVYRRFIEEFIINNSIGSVVDLGCGDWQFSKLIDWSNVRYLGLDIVPSIINTNQQKFGSKNVKFKLLSKPNDEIPKADLLLVKDVLQHLPNRNVHSFIKNTLPNYKYSLITNCSKPRNTTNTNIKTGGFRPISLGAEPFNQRGCVVLRFAGRGSFSLQKKKTYPAWEKHVYLVIND